MTIHTRLVREPIDANVLIRSVSHAANGAVLLFLGVVRDVNDGRAVIGIEYSAYEPMANRELDAIANGAVQRFEVTDVAIQHRLGALALEDASVGIAVAHPHRAAAYEASRWIIEEIKRRVPIWKREHYADGTRDWVDPTRIPLTAPL